MGFAGGLFTERRGLGFDAHGLRLYRLQVRGQSVEQKLVRMGYAKLNRHGRKNAALRAAAAYARAHRTGCVWGGRPQAAPRPAAAAPAARGLQATLPTGFSESVVATGLSNPTQIAFLPDGRMLIALKSGVVRIVKNGGLLPGAVIDLNTAPDIVNDYWDRGLLGITVDPNFASNGYIYLLYTYENNAGQYNGAKSARLSRFTMSGDTASRATEQVILGTLVGAGCDSFPAGSDCLPSDYFSHTVGNLKFASDGTLFVEVGDGANFNVVHEDALRSQNLDSLAGKLLHITPTGQGIPSNPFWNGNPNSARSKIWAYGLRNSYRMALKPGSGTPFLGDVGWNTWEEINVATAGANLGWPCYEGAAQQGGYAALDECQTLYAQGANAVKAPLVQWNHNGQSSASTGGTFYTGTVYPAQYQGAYFYGDYARSWIRYLKVDANNNVTSGPTDFATGANGPVNIEMGPDGRLYYVAISSGQVRRIDYGGAPPPPPPPPPPDEGAYLSDMTWTSATNGWGPVERDESLGDIAAGDGGPLTLAGVTYAKGLGVNSVSDIRFSLGGACSTFTAKVGIDDEVGNAGSVKFQVWTDGTLAYDSGLMTGSTATKTVNESVVDVDELRLLVTNGNGSKVNDHADWADAFVACGGNQAPVPTITSPSSSLLFAVGDTIHFAGSATDPEDGSLPASRLSWKVTLNHCQGGLCHTHTIEEPTGVSSGDFDVENHGDDIYFDIDLTATDSDGKSATTRVTIQPRTVQVTLKTVPAGLQVVWGGETGTSPMVRTAVAGSTHTIFTPSPQGGFTFGSWSDAGAQSHDVTVGTANATYTATFTGSGSVPPTLVSSTGNLNLTTNSYTYAVNFGFTANAGDLIVVAVCQDGGNGTFTHSWGGGFTELYDRDASFIICSAGYKIAAGGETSVVVTSTQSDHWSGLVWRFTGAGIPTAPTPATGNNANPNPPVNTPAGGFEDYFWISGYGADMSALPTHTGATPAGYSNFILSSNAVTTGQAIRGGSRGNAAASEDPGTYTMSATETWQAFTIAVPPLGG
jgi:glucose/arabinose dehydrogenase